MKSLLVYIIGSVLLFSCTSKPNELQLESPDGKIVCSVNSGSELSYTVSYKHHPLITNSSIGFTFANAPDLGKNLELVSSEIIKVNEDWEPVLKRYESIKNAYHQLSIELKEKQFPGRKIVVELRAYNEGVAFRSTLFTKDPDFENNILEEKTEFTFPSDPLCWAVDYKAFDSHQESEFVEMHMSEISPEMFTGLPLTFKLNEKVYGAITEAALVDYAGMYLSPQQSHEGVRLVTQLAPRHGQDRKGTKVSYKAKKTTPWRVIMLAESPGELVESELIQNLNEPCAIEDPSWIKPGVSAWDHWWSGEVKMEQEVIYEYISLASEMGWEYMLIDWQWYGQFNTPQSDITTVAPQLDMPAILKYAEERGVRCWLWLYWTDVNKADFDAACKLYHDWGIAGVKIDFMARDDQEMVNWYHDVVRTAAKHQLMVDFHGAYKPTGWRRTYPNLVTREGVMGNEYNKWSYRVTPDHDCVIPFTRMLAGPMDYTPGGFLNANPETFKTGVPAMVQGTRTHELAKFVIYDSPFMVACDHPMHYKEQVGRGFLQEVPAVWDDTKVLHGVIGEYIAMARRSGEKWFLAAMTNSEARTLQVKLDFLPAGTNYELVSFEDAGKSISDPGYALKNAVSVSSGELLTLKMVPGGGYAAFLVPVE
jgi:alpha-glucosidase